VEFEIDIVYKKGARSTNSVALSRICTAKSTATEQEKLTIFQKIHMKPIGGIVNVLWVFPRRQFDVCRRFGTFCLFQLPSLDV
jgi:hypothetical protein